MLLPISLPESKCDRMAENWRRLSDAFAYFDGAKARNPRWGWSARSPDGQTVVLTLWEDRISEDGNTVIYNDPVETGKHKPGNKDRIKNLIWARDHCEGQFRVVVTVARDTKARPRSIAKRYPHKTLVMKLTELDENTGAFRAKSVST